jgi:DnaA family protein
MIAGHERNRVKPEPQQFALDLLPAAAAPSLANFVPGSNGALLAALHEAVAGQGSQFIHLWGAPGSGRTHLLEAVHRAGAADEPPASFAATPLVPVPAFAPPRRLYTADDVHRLDTQQQAALFALQNQVREHPGTVLVTSADRPPAQLALREDVRTRLTWGLVFALQPITEDQRAGALEAYARARGARVDEDLVPYMLERLPRDMRTLVTVLDALDAFALEKQSALTVRLLRQWLRRERS